MYYALVSHGSVRIFQHRGLRNKSKINVRDFLELLNLKFTIKDVVSISNLEKRFMSFKSTVYSEYDIIVCVGEKV